MQHEHVTMCTEDIMGPTRKVSKGTGAIMKVSKECCNDVIYQAAQMELLSQLHFVPVKAPNMGHKAK